MTKDEEKGYIERVLAGDESAYEPLVTENQTKVYRLALRILKNEADAEDAAQEAFLKAYTSLADFRGDSRFSVWLYRLTNNICIDILRKNKRAVIMSLQTEDDDGEETEIAIPDEGIPPRGWPSAPPTGTPCARRSPRCRMTAAKFSPCARARG